MSDFTKPKFEVADVLQNYGDSFRLNNKLPYWHHKILNNIASCRTAFLGKHEDQCNNCNYTRITYNSCRNRHCPKCQGLNQLKWIDNRANDILPVGYFHIVFTIPAELNKLCIMNKKELYDILFKASSQTITMLTKQEKHLGALPGIISLLHTWGQNLMDHPHIHMIVSAGGLANNKNRWVNSKKDFFISVKVLSKVFRGKFLSLLKEAYNQKQLLLIGSLSRLAVKQNFKNLLNILYGKQWVVYAKKPFKNVGNVFKYLAKYTHRVAISNHRIVSIDNNEVVFKWRDYANENKKKVMTLSSDEFIRRFLLHALPKGFFKIRYYGLLANRNKHKNLSIIRKLLNVAQCNSQKEKESWQEVLLRLTNFNVFLCPKCNKGTMATRYIKISKPPS